MLVSMSADPAHRRQLGELLVERGVLTDAQLRLALAEQEASGAPLGEILVRLGFTRGATIGNALAEQHGGPLRTEYGLALGPTDGIGMPPEQTVRLHNSALALDSALVGRERVADQTREQDDAIASLNAALDERTQELERVRVELAARDQHRAELATARADLEALRIELAKARDERSAAQEFENALEQHKAELARARQERAQNDELVHELRQELERARTQLDEAANGDRASDELRLVLQQHEAEAAAVKAELAWAQLELARHAGYAGRAGWFAPSKAGQQAERTQTHEEQAPRASHAMELEQRLALAGKETNEDVTRAGQHSLRDLELTLKQHKAELEAIAAGLSRARDERTEHANRGHDVEELTRNDETATESAERELVTVARARAQRRYGAPLRTASAQEASHGDDGYRPPPLAAAHADPTDVGKPSAFTIPLWQLALLIVVVPIALYALIPVSGPLAAAVVVLLAAIALFRRRFTRWARSGSSQPTAQQTISEPPASS